MGVRLGPNASAAGTNYARSAQSTSPVMRKTAARDLLSLRHAPCQGGFPPTMNTDGALGFASVTYQKAHVAPNYREAGKFALVRLVGTSSRARPAGG